MIIVQVKIIPKDIESREKIIEFAQDLIEKSKIEEGNIDYNLLIDTSDNTLMFLEQWKCKNKLENHLKTEYLLKFNENISSLTKSENMIKVFLADQIQDPI